MSKIDLVKRGFVFGFQVGKSAYIDQGRLK